METIMPFSVAKAWLLGFGAVLGSGALATGLGYAVQMAAAWSGVGG